MENAGKKSRARLSKFIPKYSGNLNKQDPTSFGSESLIPRNFGEEPLLSYSFKYLSQENGFGLQDCEGTWFVSILNRLQSLSSHTMGSILENISLRRSLRIHEVDFSAGNVSIKRSSIESIPSNIRENDREFPFYELSITRSRGRIFGFFSNAVFYIVYLDKHHNMYPMEQGITKTSRCIDHYDDLILKLSSIISLAKRCRFSKCEIESEIDNIPGLAENIIYIALSDDDLKTLIELQKQHTWEDIFEAGMFHFLEAQ